MNAAVRVSSLRPVVVVVGARAGEWLQDGHADLELVDVLEVHGVPSAAEMEWMRGAGLLDRPFAVLLFDPRDEHLWPAVRAIVTEARQRMSAPLWLVSTGHGDRLADHLQVCVVDAGAVHPLDVAMIPIAALFRCGLTGFDVGDLATVAPPGSVGRVSQDTTLAVDEHVDRAIVLMRCVNNTTLSAVNSVALAIAAKLENADLLFATPTYDRDIAALETFVVSFRARG